MNHLIVFVKDPIKGQVKTRLAKSIGESGALLVYGELLKHTRSVCDELDLSKTVWYGNQINDNDIWNGLEKKLQVGNDLGQRMQHGFETSFANQSSKVVIIGSDCFDIGAKHIQQAYEALDSNDIVIGPAEDGGYYLLGMNKIHPSLFKDIEWSTNEVFEKSKTKIESENLQLHLLPLLNDIDDESDLMRSRPLLIEEINTQS